MEMAEQLIGVTMQEQGVSRIVTVDMPGAMQPRRGGLTRQQDRDEQPDASRWHRSAASCSPA